ncbi:Photosystem I reaction center subunit psaK, chloroplastic [Vitis vinifera]|uniref:Photosystem I reaction center subunit psaK, chloroplastic n=1 Tax=Vitis vinifera TaxID=29760 RepID=A0A438GQM1_VITVI|nr:Photosystem I reaction center subunit psaK, chloroplastic [Vitis vinifera]RVW74482.1 Photosystem I reaction center subunit psaK, chloroplastic [Vitis vinifera]
MATTVMTTLPQFNGLRPKSSTSPVQTLVSAPFPFSWDRKSQRNDGMKIHAQIVVSIMHTGSSSTNEAQGQGALGARCDFIGSPTNLIMVTSTSLMLFAGRFGLAPSANRKATVRIEA